MLVVVALFYVNVSRAYFCGYDDFNETYWAEFVDARNPAHILTRTHFISSMFRPVTSGLQYGTWALFGFDPLAFRLRNLAMHLFSTAAVFGIALLLGRSTWAATGAALLFGLSPVANEAVAVAIWTNTTAYALVLWSFFLFAYSLERAQARRWFPPLAGSLLLAFLALFTYEPAIVVFGFIYGYGAIRFRREPLIPRAFLGVLIGATALELGAFFGARHLLAITGTDFVSAGVFLHNAAVYGAGLLSPIDSVLAHAVFGVPLPSTPTSAVALLWPALLGAVVLLTLAALGLARPAGPRLRSVDWPVIAFLVAAIPFSILPILAFRPHPSEFNLYVPAALYAVALSVVWWKLSRGPIAYSVVVGFLVVSYACGTFVRNERVVACGRIVSHILAQLPAATWRTGSWHVRLATPASEKLATPFGIYNYEGLETIEVPAAKTPGAQEAARIVTGNDAVTVDVVDPAALSAGCTVPHTCYLVSANGDVKEVHP